MHKPLDHFSSRLAIQPLRRRIRATGQQQPDHLSIPRQDCTMQRLLLAVVLDRDVSAAVEKQ